MSTQKPGSTDGMQDPSTPTGYVGQARELLESLDLDTIKEAMQSLTRSAEQMEQSLALFGEAWNRMMGQSTDIPEG